MTSLKQILLLSLCTLLVFPSLWAEEKKSGVKSFYNVEANIGISTRREISRHQEHYYNHSYHVIDDEAKLIYKTLVYGCNFKGGIEFRHYFKLGLGIGYSYYKQEDNSLPYYFFEPGIKFYYYPHFPLITPKSITTHNIPLYLYVRSDFFDKDISPFIDFKIGNNFLVTKETVDILNNEFMPMGYNIGDFRLKNGLYLATNIGVCFKLNNRSALNLSIGYQSVSRKHDLWNNYGSNNNFKTGYTVTDHQFLFNLGITF